MTLVVWATLYLIVGVLLEMGLTGLSSNKPLTHPRATTLLLILWWPVWVTIFLAIFLAVGILQITGRGR